MRRAFDPTAEFDSAMAAFDKAEQACALTIDDVALRADIAELIEAVPIRERRRAWAQAANDCGVDPRHGWYLFSATITTEGALLDFFTDRDMRDEASALLKAGA
ncbi:hypothetical protein R2360_13615 [Mycobacteroides chelonae]|nr:hypothetical protein [Mycobacteroides chelonae]MEC4843349.1 hypothetical protein [Mycobacteroides chelonae]